jgi:hypothetical protein
MQVRLELPGVIVYWFEPDVIDSEDVHRALSNFIVGGIALAGSYSIGQQAAISSRAALAPVVGF